VLALNLAAFEGENRHAFDMGFFAGRGSTHELAGMFRLPQPFHSSTLGAARVRGGGKLVFTSVGIGESFEKLPQLGFAVRLEAKGYVFKLIIVGVQARAFSKLSPVKEFSLEVVATDQRQPLIMARTLSSTLDGRSLVFAPGMELASLSSAHMSRRPVPLILRAKNAPRVALLCKMPSLRSQHQAEQPKFPSQLRTRTPRR
jgi:hypothetical protein